MAKRKITVTVDEELVEVLRQLDAGSISSVVNNALTEHVEKLGRLKALGMMLDEWDREFGPVDDPALEADARAAFDEAAGIIPRQTA